MAKQYLSTPLAPWECCFNIAYSSAGADSEANRASIGSFNESFSAWYEGTKPAGRTAQFVGGCQREGLQSGISTRAIFAD